MTRLCQYFHLSIINTLSRIDKKIHLSLLVPHEFTGISIRICQYLYQKSQYIYWHMPIMTPNTPIFLLVYD